MASFIDRTGSLIAGHLVLGLDHWKKSGSRRYPLWKFRCDCSAEFVAQADQVARGTRVCPSCRPRGKLAVDLSGKKFGKLVVLERVGTKKTNNGQTAVWLTQCNECRSSFERTTYKLKKIEGCPCKKRHGNATAGTISRTYSIWKNMHARCTQKSSPSYPSYGARGIAVCERWLSFENFLADMGTVPTDFTLDRIENSLGYFKDNCRWATRKEQNRNRSVTHMITYQGETLCLKDWADRLGINYATLRFRIIRRGWSIEDAFTWKKGRIRANRRKRKRNELGQWISD